MVFRWWLEGKVGPRIARPGTLFPLGLTLSLPPWPPTVLTHPLHNLTPTYKENPLDRIKTISIRASSVSMSVDNLFLGLDLSTQQLKAILLNENGSLVHETSVHFDNDLPHYGTTNGAIQGPDEGEVTSPVAMWVEAVDLLLERMKSGGVEFGRIRGVSGAGQVRFPIFNYHIRQLALTHFFDISFSNMDRYSGPMRRQRCSLRSILGSHLKSNSSLLRFQYTDRLSGKTHRLRKSARNWTRLQADNKHLPTSQVVAPMRDLQVHKLLGYVECSSTNSSR